MMSSASQATYVVVWVEQYLLIFGWLVSLVLCIIQVAFLLLFCAASVVLWPELYHSWWILSFGQTVITAVACFRFLCSLKHWFSGAWSRQCWCDPRHRHKLCAIWSHTDVPGVVCLLDELTWNGEFLWPFFVVYVCSMCVVYSLYLFWKYCYIRYSKLGEFVVRSLVMLLSL